MTLPCAMPTKFSALTDLLPHQAEAVAKLLPARVGALFMDMGTGKSRTTIELARLRQAKIDRVLWFCPVSLKETIRAEIRKHTDSPERSIYVFGDLGGSTAVPWDAMWYVIGIESMSSSTRAIFAANRLVTDRTFAIVDESSYIKGHDSNRTRHITTMCRPARYRLILNGTPLSQGYEDLYAQMRFLDPRILGYNSFYSFAANHLEYSDKYPGMIVRAHNVPYLAAKIKPYVYQVTKEECLTLPDKLYETYHCALTPEQAEAYRLAKDEILDDTDPNRWDSSVTIFRLFTALQSIVCGFWTHPRGRVEVLPHNRLTLLLEVLRLVPANEKVIIWARYHRSVEEIVTALIGSYGADSVCQYHGRISERRREQELSHWRTGGRFLVATEGVGGRGQNWAEAAYVVFYANGFKYDDRKQAEDRVYRIGQQRRPTYIDLMSDSTIERRIHDALARKGSALRAFREEVERVKRTNKDRVRGLVRSL